MICLSEQHCVDFIIAVEILLHQYLLYSFATVVYTLKDNSVCKPSDRWRAFAALFDASSTFLVLIM